MKGVRLQVRYCPLVAGLPKAGTSKRAQVEELGG